MRREELECVLDQFPKYHMEILLGDFNVEVEGEDIFKLTRGNENLHEITNDNCVRVVNYATSKSLISSIITFIHKLGFLDMGKHTKN